MADYPDFANYKVPRFGSPKLLEASQWVASGATIEIGSVVGVGTLFMAHCWITNEIGGEATKFYINLDGVGVYARAFQGMFDYGLWQYGNMFTYLSKYDLVEGDFGVVTGIGVTFEESVAVKYWHSLGHNVLAHIALQYALLE